MSQVGVDLIRDATERIKLALKEDRFTKEEMELLLRYFEKCVEATKNTLERGPKRDPRTD